MFNSVFHEILKQCKKTSYKTPDSTGINMIQLQKKSANHLISAYNQMIHEMHDAFEQTGSGYISLQKALEVSKQKVLRNCDVSAEEAYEIGEFIKRDINDAAEYMMENRADFFDWLSLDIEVIERKIIDMFLAVADNTRLELERIR